MLAAPESKRHDVIVTGLSMGNVDATMLQMLIIFNRHVISVGRRDDRRNRHHQAGRWRCGASRKPRAKSSTYR